MSKLKAHNYFLFELWVLIRVTAVGAIGIAVTMLVQDKICINKYHQSIEYCQQISKDVKSAAEQSTRDHILADSTKFSTYKYDFRLS